MFNGLYFEHPLFALLILLFFVCERFCPMRTPSIYFPHANQFMKNPVSSSKLLFLLKWLGIIFMILALMSPVKDEPYELKPKNGYEIGLILDTSGSMREQGFDRTNPRLNKFDVVKSIVSDFISQRQNDNIGLVAFGSYSFIASPLTYDKDILKGILSKLSIGIAGRQTALYDAIAQGVNLLKRSKSKTKIAILLTDGMNTAGQIPLDTALDMAKKEHIKIYTIGIGSSKDYNSRVLLKIAKETGGVAFGASSANKLQKIYKKIDSLEKSKIKNKTFTYMKYYYIYPLFLSLILLMLYVYLRNRRGHA